MRLTTLNTLKRGILSCVLILAGHAAHTQHTHHRHLEFIPNQGQEKPSVRYSARVSGGKLFVEDGSLLYHLQDNSDIETLHHGGKVAHPKIKGHVYRMRWVNAQKPTYNNSHKTGHYYNFFRGNNPAKWKGGVYAYQELEMKELYPGISVKLETNEDERLEYTYTVAPGASPLQIIQQYEHTGGISISSNGDLVIKTNVGQIKELKPVAWQMVKGKKQPVPCTFKLSQNRVSYDFPKGYNAGLALIIDPVLIFGSYSGSTADNFGMTATYDNSGHLYAGGTAFDIGYPTTPGAYDTTSNSTMDGTGAGYGITDVVLTKYAPDGGSLVYSTYLGGGDSLQGTETVHSLIVNDNDELMCFGATSSTDFPTTASAFQSGHAGGSSINFLQNGVYFQPTGTDIYVTKFNSTGTALVGSTYIGGSGNDGVNYKVSSGTYSTPASYDSLTSNYGDQFRGEIMIDSLNNIYVATTTRSADFPLQNPYQPSLAGSQDAVVFKLDPTLSNLIFSTYLGGSDKDAGYSVKLDGSGNVFVTGGTSSLNFPSTPGALNPVYKGGKTDGFISKLSPSGNVLMASSFIGTNAYDQSIFVEIDKNDLVYLYGNTSGPASFPIVSAGFSNPNSGQFIMRLDNNLSAISFSTLFGNGSGGPNISPSAFLVDVCGNIYVSGWGGGVFPSSPAVTGMPVTADALQPAAGHGFNFYLACFQRNMTGLLYGSYFGGNTSKEHVDGGTSRFDKHGIIYQSVCAGCGSNDDFPTTFGAWSQTNNSGNCNNGVFKFDFEITPEADFITDFLAGCAPLTIQFTNTSPPGLYYVWDFGNGDTTTVYSPVMTYPDTGTYTVTLVTEDSICGLIDTALKVITVHPHLEVSSLSDTVFCTGTIYDLVASANNTSNTYIWSTSPLFTDTLNAPLTDSTLNASIQSDTVFYVQTQNPWCTISDTVEILIHDLDPQITAAVTSCAGDSALLTVSNPSPETYTVDWSPNSEILSGDGTPSIIVAPDDTVTYTATLTTPYCTNSADYELVLAPVPIAGLQATAEEDTITPGNSTQLYTTPTLAGATYVWAPANGLSNPFIGNPVATPQTTTTYYVTVSVGGCVRTDTVTIVVMDFVCGDPYIFLPNAFTPNGDGANDVLYLRGNNIEKAYLAIFERWGEKVFETSDMNFGWDGKVNGRDADPAVFDYYLEVTCTGGVNYFQKGNVTLIR